MDPEGALPMRENGSSRVAAVTMVEGYSPLSIQNFVSLLAFVSYAETDSMVTQVNDTGQGNSFKNCHIIIACC